MTNIYNVFDENNNTCMCKTTKIVYYNNTPGVSIFRFCEFKIYADKMYIYVLSSKQYIYV